MVQEFTVRTIPGTRPLLADVVNGHGAVILGRVRESVAARTAAGLCASFERGDQFAVAAADAPQEPRRLTYAERQRRDGAIRRRETRRLAVAAVNLWMPPDREPYR